MEENKELRYCSSHKSGVAKESTHTPRVAFDLKKDLPLPGIFFSTGNLSKSRVGILVVV
jgi:hypothetical protein